MLKLFVASLVGALVAHVLVENGWRPGVALIALALVGAALVDLIGVAWRVARSQFESKGGAPWNRPATPK